MKLTFKNRFFYSLVSISRHVYGSKVWDLDIIVGVVLDRIWFSGANYG